ncbi:MAG: glycosyltransferase [Anaerolineae bacterium]|nr:glycosyltransferase [Anaerolineae bacterium]
MDCTSQINDIPSISVIMPCYNRSFDLVHVLEAYDRQDSQLPFEIIAVDDASSDNTLDILNSYKPEKYKLKVSSFSVNQGPAAARNRAIQETEAPLILFVGDDVRPGKTFISGHIAAHTQKPDSKISILGRTIWAADIPQNSLMAHIDGIGAQQFSYYYLRSGNVYDYRHLYTSNISIKTAFLKSMDHWFDTDFEYAAFEDVELAYRMAKKGLRIVYDATIEAEHYHYHTIWSFATRQYRSGVMARVLIRKHPWVLTKLIQPKLLKYIPTLFLAVVCRKCLKHKEGALSDHLEDLALHIASYFEWSTSSFLDRYYQHILRYFYNKGIVSGFIVEEHTKKRVQNLYAHFVLRPILMWFYQETVVENDILPVEYRLAIERLPDYPYNPVLA